MCFGNRDKKEDYVFFQELKYSQISLKSVKEFSLESVKTNTQFGILIQENKQRQYLISTMVCYDFQYSHITQCYGKRYLIATILNALPIAPTFMAINFVSGN